MSSKKKRGMGCTVGERWLSLRRILGDLRLGADGRVRAGLSVWGRGRVVPVSPLSAIWP